jgi:hypothetical protein
MPETPADEGTLDVGVQDKSQAVRAGRAGRDGAIYFECNAEARIDDLTKELDFRGPFVQGTPQARFLYLSWKWRVTDSAPWYWRVKVPLASVALRDIVSMKPGEVLMADITGRRPHSSAPVVWERAAASEA